ncbi:uncharacterized protein HKW66_Vig0145180 [Vigna angularis]|uniref:Homologous recombination OB-fold protein OB-fold domain-containing protein n=1 Tax=Phaseolus angularis TaxID=3914 RepID=A0A8T0KC99_PHAAN|nr:uncharacterized protein LOC108339349 [Vigna angularis]KAG2397246.1 uncharacterized protein HKW66_Vig0145180 [Vigna angularis]
MQFERMESWEGLDIDDSDLKAFLKKCNSTATLIPGPAANVQAAMLNRQTDEPKSTQEFVNDIAKATFDRDFKSNPWIWAEKFIKHHGLVQDGNINNVTQLERVKSMHVLPFVACIVKECNPNGLGDMKIVVKDQSTSLSASVHNKVLLHPEFGPDIGVGAVLLLQSVGALSPFGRIYYLNITVRNIVKVFKADIGPPTEELLNASSRPVIRPNPCAENNNKDKDVGPSEKACPSRSNNKTTTTMED